MHKRSTLYYFEVMIAFFLFFVGILSIIFAIWFFSSFSTWGVVLLTIVLIFLIGALIAYIAGKCAKYVSKPIASLLLWFRVIYWDCICQTLLFLLYPLAFFSHRSKGKKTPIILVHGYLLYGYTFIYLLSFFKKYGFTSIYTINLGNPFSSMEKYAQKLEKQCKNFSEVILIGHSMGGLIASYYALNLAKKGKVKSVITLAAPLQGTKVANIAIGRCGRQMEIGSAFLHKLYDQMEKSSIPFYHIQAIHDPIVIGPSLEKKENIRYVEGIGHISLLFSKRVAHMVKQWLPTE